MKGRSKDFPNGEMHNGSFVSKADIRNRHGRIKTINVNCYLSFLFLNLNGKGISIHRLADDKQYQTTAQCEEKQCCKQKYNDFFHVFPP